MFFQGDISFNDEIYITNARQKKALEDARKSLEYVENSIENQMPEDFYSIDSWEPMKRWERFWGKIWERIWSTKSFQNSVPASEEKICQ